MPLLLPVVSPFYCALRSQPRDLSLWGAQQVPIQDTEVHRGCDTDGAVEMPEAAPHAPDVVMSKVRSLPRYA